LQNLIGSVHHWVPYLQVVVYDMGLTPEQEQQVENWKDVILEKLPSFYYFPAHIKDLSNEAWKPLFMYLAFKKYGSIFWLDVTHELRNGLDSFSLQLNRDGIFAVTIIGDITEQLRVSQSEKMFKIMKLDPEDMIFRPLCSPRVFGLSRTSYAFNTVLLPAVKCALDPHCWLNINTSGRRVDALFSMLIYNSTCYTCNRDWDFYAWAGVKQPPVERSTPLNILYLSPGHIVVDLQQFEKIPEHYTKYVLQRNLVKEHD